MADRSPCVCAKVRRASRTLTALYDDALAPCGLTTPQLTLLSTLAKRGPLSISKFAERTGHDRSTLNRSIRPLVEAGHIRAVQGSDRRETVLELGPSGEAAIARCTPHWETAQARVADALGANRAALVGLLDRIEEPRP